MITVVIDPGHYTGYNKGVAAGYYEGNATFRLAQYIKEELQSGTDQVKVIMTKGTMAENPSVFARGKVAVSNRATVFLSLHSNAVADAAKYEKAYGVSVYRSLFLPDSEDLGNKLADAIVEIMAPVTGVTYSRGVLTRKSDITGKDYYGVIRGAVNSAGTVAQASAGAVKHAFIIEHGFHTNSRECAFLTDDNNLKKIAKAEAYTIKEHFGIIGGSLPDHVGGSAGQKIPQEPLPTTKVVGRVKVIYEGQDGLSIHTTPEWGSHNLNTKKGPVHAGEIFSVTEKVKVGTEAMYKLLSGAGYITASEKYVTFTASSQEQSHEVTREIKAGDTVKVLRNVTYTGGSFKLYRDKYTVLSVSGNRAVIGIGKVVTAAVNVRDIAVA
ncbi:MAG: N-acetylmuramoyl-L-alanine amidase [Lachnospiraceae bacterium]|nr:N-acetylmuramoyl-L-alanine amidase [Lachnospiraceae bacterium]